VRRLRSDLRGFRELVDRDWSDALRQELRWLGTELGDVRDLDVLLARLRADSRRAGSGAGRDPGIHAVLKRVQADRRAKRNVLLEALQSKRYADLRSRLAVAAREPAITLAGRLKASGVLTKIVRRRWKRLSACVTQLTARPSTRSLHRIRILAKRCRYAAEAAHIAVGDDAKRFAARAADLQDVLGELNDACFASAALRRLGRSPDTAVAASALLALETDAVIRARASWRDAWRALDDKRLRSWF
jgi:CHAD domain-containing protein